MGLMFEVAEGGFLDIDVRIVGPDGKTIHQVHTRLNHKSRLLYWTMRAKVLPTKPPGRKGIEWKVYICCSYGRCLPVLLLKPDVHHDSQDCNVQHGHWRSSQWPNQRWRGWRGGENEAHWPSTDLALFQASHNKLEDMIKELSTALTGVKHEQEYMQAI